MFIWSLRRRASWCEGLWERVVLVAFHAPAAYFALRVFPDLVAGQEFEFPAIVSVAALECGFADGRVGQGDIEGKRGRSQQQNHREGDGGYRRMKDHGGLLTAG